jgi:hypothetical protein
MESVSGMADIMGWAAYGVSLRTRIPRPLGTSEEDHILRGYPRTSPSPRPSDELVIIRVGDDAGPLSTFASPPGLSPIAPPRTQNWRVESQGALGLGNQRQFRMALGRVPGASCENHQMQGFVGPLDFAGKLGEALD